MPSPTLWNALIRTHHITSRKKVAKLRQAASTHSVYALLRSGGAPGIMYVEGEREGVEGWVGLVNRLRYKDYQLVARPAVMRRVGAAAGESELMEKGLFETESVKDFAMQMERRGVLEWWRKGMGYVDDEHRL